ncbi:phosphonoacetaldehyde hydrolase [Paenibacillus lycopersici]|uniref:Phosphonoacetaldehyde hydrolase n=1 Tax=Paenibacillus lycopersici TaxID=2704462 RepID=A0A6C0FWI5_9BACL|nr:phosphonoacetaldehyde hydrolase [Paenibacillus lycopersici]QHT58550.1 phosphonoacetaldehyde hydrolase [Paenibacillus lycopersici]
MRTDYNGKIQAVILDWAGTVIDYGCFAPLNVFIAVFRQRGIEIATDEARKPMGLLKRDHIAALCAMPRIAAAWQARFGDEPAEADIDELYRDFESLQLQVLPHYTDLIPGALETVGRLRALGLKIGSTTGYTRGMMDIVAPEAGKKGYTPDSLVTPNEAPAGRPHPWMCYRNAMNLGVYPLEAYVKAGDTISDIQEGLNAGMWSVGVVKGGSELGLSEAEVNALSPEELEERMNIVKSRFLSAGAHYVIDSIAGLPDVIERINARMANQEEAIR